MKRIAIVVPRCHESLVGGAEAHAWQYATLLADSCAVEVLTTTASDYVNWANDLPAGEEWRDGVLIRRFRVARGRTGYFHDLHRRLLAEFAASAGAAAAQRVRWPEALLDEFIRRGADMLGWELDELFERTIAAMQSFAPDRDTFVAGE